MRSLIIAVKFLISLALLFFLFSTSKLDISLLYHLLESPLLLISCLLLYFLNILLSAWRWQQLSCTQKIHLSLVQSIIPTYLGVAFNNLLPGGVGGDFYRFYFLNNKKHIKRSVSMACIFFDRAIGLVGIVTLIGLVALLYFIHIISHKYSTCWMWFGLTIGAGSLFFLFISPNVSVFLLEKIQATNRNNIIISKIIAVLQALSLYRRAKETIVKSIIVSIVIQIIICLTCIIFAKIMHFPTILFSDYMIAIAICQIVNLIPISPGGIGVGELAFANILLMLNPGVIATYATIFLAFRIVGILIYLPSFLFFIFEKNISITNLRESY